ncbi:MAG: glutathione synthase [Pseudomonadales bacterium]|jgi:glutathione synthase|nr:glutathione synthase [Pseudomonadales bacterium]MDP6469465.1 glutathione synthase [Pseudomonadales bacterium]MDP6827307.1 glutathione synthase [Pseudomonadales bacterium]MDP6971130.1 glutathione synthase [Pseudomonadales bacterium]|tara:strand:- start:358 stop:1329 length:972 start_codon:yes stop_codon:yes gene_type:complete
MQEIAFVMDPLESLALKKDSTLAMIRSAQQRGWQITYLQQTDLFFAQEMPMALCRRLELTEPFAQSLAPEDATNGWYRLGTVERKVLADFDIIMMRKDPPFDMDYIYTTYILERAEALGVKVVNKPSSLRDCNEKFFATFFPQCCPALLVSSSETLLREFQSEHGHVVFKRLDGMGGMSVFRIMDGDPNIGVVIETLTSGGREQIMAQQFLPEIEVGDKRILLVNGEPVDYALARIPKAGEARGNLAAGGTGIGQPLSDRDRWIATQVGPEVARRGLSFVGIDVIGDYLTEVNVTCPTCIRELDAQFSLDIAGMLMDSIIAPS